jgi:hypothetical protein
VICGCIAILAGLIPLTVTWWANRRTSLRDATGWAAIAWLTWSGPLNFQPTADIIFIALAVTGGAGIAVLGARRPHVFAWNFVVLGLVSVLVLPLVEGWIIGIRSLDALRLSFLAGTLIVGIGNYVPTRFGAAAAVALLVVGGWFAILLEPALADRDALFLTLRIATASVPWIALVSPNRAAGDDLGNAWRSFRDRLGFVWGERTREQFNRAAENAGLPIRLGWRGVRGTGSDTEMARAVEIFKRLVRRFDDSGVSADESSEAAS